MIVIGLTGSIGMGKSTAGAMLERLGVPVHDSDAAVHELLRPGSVAWPALTAGFPYSAHPQIYRRAFSFREMLRFSKTRERSIDRAALGRIVFADAAARGKLEAILHPFVQDAQRGFIQRQRALGRKIVALDIPLLFETGAEARVDYTLVVTAPAHVQHARVMARRGMSAEKLKGILARQMPDGEKRARADFVVHSGLGRAYMMREIKTVLQTVKEKHLKRREKTCEEDHGRPEGNRARYRNDGDGPCDG